MASKATKSARIFRGRISGFTLIETLVVLIIIGIIAGLAVRSMRGAGEVVRTERTKDQLDRIAWAIAGNPDELSNGSRVDFGYVGDVGALPPNLDALVSDPGLGTWDGPYLQDEFYAASGAAASRFKTDGWGTGLSYSGGVDVVSSGSGNSMTRRVAGSVDDLLYNQVTITVTDRDGTPPGPDYQDSVHVVLTHPDGSGGTANRNVSPGGNGLAQIDSVPVGLHRMRMVYEPTGDTLTRYVSVNPKLGYRGELQYPGNVWGGGTGSTPPEPPDLVGRWPLDESSDTLAPDISGLNNHGALRNMDPGSDWIAGKIDNCLDFDGTNDYVVIPHSDVLNGAKMLTYAAWVFPTDWTGTRQVMAKSVHGGGSGRAQMGLFAAGGSLTGRAETTDGRFNVYAGLPPLDEWSHVALVFDSMSLTLYIDGAIAGAISLPNTSLQQTTDDMCISKRVGTSQYFFQGKIDDIRVYNRDLNSAEVHDLYEMGD